MQKTKDHFLEVKMESSKQRLFHFLSDLAYIEVRGWALQRAGVLADGWWQAPWAVVTH